jgi:tRNA(fMet)-specific endonuclease VapC
MVVLDTDHVSLLQWKQSADGQRLDARPKRIQADQQATTIITYEEQSRGWLALVTRARSMEEQIEAYDRLQRHCELYRRFELLAYDRPAAKKFSDLQGLRLKLGTQDLNIAVSCLANNALLLSRNLRDFRRVPGLKVEDWAK